MYPFLFSQLDIRERKLKNRITMAPLYLGYAGQGGVVSPLLLEHYRLMARSGAAMVVVENATVEHPLGDGANRVLRADTEETMDGLAQLAATIQEEGALACLQLNHAGRFAAVEQPVAPSEVETFGGIPRALTESEIQAVQESFAAAAKRAQRAGFDMVELHGGTGYLLAQFLSPRTNKRDDAYGGSLENRMRFPLETYNRVREEVGDFPVGYRFLADELLPDGLKLEESTLFARSLEDAGIDYLSVMGGTYESFALPEIIEQSKTPGYMAHLAGSVKSEVRVPVIAAGRIQSGELAERILAEGQADLIGLARILWVDPEWPQKVKQGREEEILPCDPECEDVCMQLVMQGKPAFCPQWPPDKTRQFKDMFS
ncbi:MAG: NADH:flavin oxidoreductase [Desulfohalobiaceae bacterium]|nr:NADH:flavin oxidoreductase [Desulfohalobiaceae bacterium]